MAKTIEALKASALEIHEFHRTAYPTCDGGCPAHAALKLIEEALEDEERHAKNMITMRRPPWPCVDCGAEITVFEWIADNNGDVRDEGWPTGSFKATCTACGEVIYS